MQSQELGPAGGDPGPGRGGAMVPYQVPTQTLLQIASCHGVTDRRPARGDHGIMMSLTETGTGTRRGRSYVLHHSDGGTWYGQVRRI